MAQLGRERKFLEDTAAYQRTVSTALRAQATAIDEYVAAREGRPPPLPPLRPPQQPFQSPRRPPTQVPQPLPSAGGSSFSSGQAQLQSSFSSPGFGGSLEEEQKHEPGIPAGVTPEFRGPSQPFVVASNSVLEDATYVSQSVDRDRLMSLATRSQFFDNDMKNIVQSQKVDLLILQDMNGMYKRDLIRDLLATNLLVTDPLEASQYAFAYNLAKFSIKNEAQLQVGHRFAYLILDPRPEAGLGDTLLALFSVHLNPDATTYQFSVITKTINDLKVRNQNNINFIVAGNFNFDAQTSSETLAGVIDMAFKAGLRVVHDPLAKVFTTFNPKTKRLETTDLMFVSSNMLRSNQHTLPDDAKELLTFGVGQDNYRTWYSNHSLLLATLQTI
jgi:endonuclease/exonuclease/phosphatase family metal-dependent hydrolase